MVRTYRKYIAESRNLVYPATFLVILLRFGFLFTTEYQPKDSSNSFFTYNFPFFFENRYIPFVCSLVLTVIIGLQLTHLNYRYTLIRRKTSLPYIFTLFLLSVFPDYIYLISPHLGVIIILLSIDILFGSYHQAKASRQAFNIGFALSITGFVFPGLLLYLIIFWIGFTYMRSFGFKAFLASLFAVGMIYWLRFSYLAYTQKPDNIIEKLMQGWDNFYVSRILPVEKTETFVLAAIYVFAVLVVIFNGYVHRFDDKMQVRTNFLFLKYLLLFAVILHLFLFYYTSINLIIALVISGFILSHFFALAGKKWKVYFFILLLILYFANYAWIAVTSIELI